MKFLVYFVTILGVSKHAVSEIRNSVVLNKLLKARPVGGNVQRVFLPLTEIPPPKLPKSGRRHLEDDCREIHQPKVVDEGGRVDIVGDYYDDNVAKTVATVIIPNHIDIKHFEVTTQVPYLTVGHIEAIGYHPEKIHSEHPSECEKIYQDHLEDQYSEEVTDYSDESLEMAKMPLIGQEAEVINEDDDPDHIKFYDEFLK